MPRRLLGHQSEVRCILRRAFADFDVRDHVDLDAADGLDPLPVPVLPHVAAFVVEPAKEFDTLNPVLFTAKSVSTALSASALTVTGSCRMGVGSASSKYRNSEL